MKRTASLNIASIAFAALLLSACGGGSGGSTSSLPSAPQRGASGNAVFQITIPLPSTQGSSRAPHYVSPNTQSVSILLVSANGSPVTQPPTVANVSPTAPGCTVSGSTLSCTVSVPSIVGSDVFSVTMFAGTNATGAQLSSGQATATINPGVLNTVPVTLNGVIASILVTLANSSPPTGASTDIVVNVIAKDSTGATIVGPGTYNNPVTLADSDSSGATTLSTTTVTGPGAAVTLHYTGNASLTSATISAASSGIPASAITNAKLTPGQVVSVASGSGALAIFTNGAGQTYAYLPSGTGLTQVLISSGSIIGQVAQRTPATSGGSRVIPLSPAPDACATDSAHALLYCIAYRSAVVNVLDLSTAPATVKATYTTDASGSLSFTGGTCLICGVAFDSADNGAIIATSAGYELYGAPPGNAKLKTIAAHVSENFGYNASKNQVFSPHYPGAGSDTGMDLVDIASGNIFALNPNPAGLSEPDQGAVDAQTNIAITSNEFSNDIYLLPLNQATLNSPAAGQFSVPLGTVNLMSSLSSACDTMLDDIAVDSQAHLAFFTGEFCSPGPVGVAQLPSTGAAGATVSDFNFANVPDQPNGAVWNEAHDPHAVATFNVPGLCADCGAIFNYDRSYLAVVDLKKLLAAPRDTTDAHMSALSFDLICNNVVTFIASDPTTNGNSGCATGSASSINVAGGSWTAPSAGGFSATGGYGANANAGGTYTITTTTDKPSFASLGGFSTGQTNVAFFEIVGSTDVTFTSNGLAFTTATIPAWLPASATYTAYFYDLTVGGYCGNSGPGTLSGRTVTFNPASSVGPTSTPPANSGCVYPGHTTVPAGHVMAAVLAYPGPVTSSARSRNARSRR